MSEINHEQQPARPNSYAEQMKPIDVDRVRDVFAKMAAQYEEGLDKLYSYREDPQIAASKGTPAGARLFAETATAVYLREGILQDAGQIHLVTTIINRVNKKHGYRMRVNPTESPPSVSGDAARK